MLAVLAASAISNGLGLWSVDWSSADGPMFAPPDGRYWLGTNLLGQDVFARLVQATVHAFNLGAAVALGAVLLGTALGAVAGYWPGSPQDGITSVALGTAEALPVYFLAGAFAIGFGAGTVGIAVALALAFSTSTARVVRARIRAVRDAEFLETARFLGIPGWRIALFQLPPLVLPMVLVQLALTFVAAVKVHAVLEFLGLVQGHHVSFGMLLAEAAQQIVAGDLALLLPVGLTFFALVLLVQSLAEALADRYGRRGGIDHE